MIEVYNYLNGHSPDMMNDIFKVRENMCNFRNFHIYQIENHRSLKYGLNAIPYRANQLWQQVACNIMCNAANIEVVTLYLLG